MKKLRANWRRWRRARRRRHAAEEFRNIPLREFVYLDDVSVYSLISSRLGAVAAEFSESESASLVSEISSASAASAGVLKGEIGARTEASKSYGSQVVRKSIIQSQFKELVEIEHDRMIIKAGDDGEEIPKIESDQEFELLLAKDRSDGLIVGPKTLQRGELIEIEVELDAEAIFRLNAIIATLLDLLKENPELLGDRDKEGIPEIATVRRILDRLSVGLVPLKGRAVGYRSLNWQGAEYLVDERLLRQLPSDSKIVCHPTYVVGVAEADLFWRDIRRVLFSGSRYLVMCRIGRSGVQEDWTPLKLLDVLKDVVPGLPELLGNGGEGLMEMLKSGTHSENRDGQQLMRVALVDYAQAIAQLHGKSVSEADLSHAGLLGDQQLSAYEPIDKRRAAFEMVTRYIGDRLGVEKIDPEQAAKARAEAIEHSEAVLASAPRQEFDVEVADPAAQRFLDTEIVAIYW